ISEENNETNSTILAEKDFNCLVEEVMDDINDKTPVIKDPATGSSIKIKKPKTQNILVVLIANNNKLQLQSESPDDGFTLISQRKKKDKKSKKDLTNQK
ncbi:20615_t:CDS:1, partial [Cetraspora pellucida]